MSHGLLNIHTIESRLNLDIYEIEDIVNALSYRISNYAQCDSYFNNQSLLSSFQNLKDILVSKLNNKSWRLSPLSQIDTFSFINYARRNYGLSLNNTNVVDIGSGSVNPYGRMFTHILAGANRCYCFEPEPIYNEILAIKALADIFDCCINNPTTIFRDYQIDRHQILDNSYGFDIKLLLDGDSAGINSSKLTLHQQSATSTFLNSSSIDLVVSNSVLEHIEDLNELIKEMYRITKPGGFGAHGVDFRDHRIYFDTNIHPLESLKFDSAEPIVFGINRLRPHEIETIFKANGFEVLDTTWRDKEIELDQTFINTLCKPWADMSPKDLACLWVIFLVRKV